ncbi:MAG: hypothetical protein FWF23_01075 [Alphaproteobacteria bacterium]|nr:hypothetical protein [Alphaproteobacteria bacterium]MCL2504699.1 hypothetical protein [Alphaproteobacteria bacterium]
MRIKLFLCLVLCFSIMALTPAFANIAITPFYIDFDAASNKRVVSVKVTNTTSEKQTYRAHFINYKQKPDGSLEEITKAQEDPNAPFAEPYLTVSPRQFTIDPGIMQTVNVGRKPMPNVPDGEYVSYLMIREITPPTPIEQTQASDKEFGVNIKALYATAIPVLLIKGQFTSGTALSEIESAGTPKDSKNALIAVTLEREGTRSSYGSIQVMDGSDVVGEIKNLRVLLSTKSRRVVIQLKKPESELKGKKLRIIFKDGRTDNTITEEKVVF